MRIDADVAIVGAGPVGCVAALAHARRGARVALLEATPNARKRFAGELLHPPAVAALREVGIDHVAPALDHRPNEGFAVFADRPGAPFLLDHAGERGITFEFNRFVAFLREQALAHPGVTWLPGHRVTDVARGSLAFTDERGTEGFVQAPRIVGADGRFSHVRRSLGLPHDRTKLSHMAGLLLRGVTLPHEGRGHVMLGRMGPVLAYRIAADEVRVCIDVPAAWKRIPERDERVADAIAPQLAPELREPITEALRRGEAVWAQNEVRPRTVMHRQGVALVGDAAGHFHPMTGIGMTLGFGDAVALARHDDLDAWAAERRADTLSPALLATALYEIFSVESPPTVACRRAIFDMWADRPALRERSMALLCCEDPRLHRLLATGAEMVARAGLQVGVGSARAGDLAEGVGGLGRLAGLLRWLALESVPPAMRWPAVTAAATPFAALRERHAPALPTGVAS